MANENDNRARILYLQRLFLNETDEDHAISTPQIIKRMADVGITTERRTIYSDIKALREYGMNIDLTRNVGYKVLDRDFELVELKILADAVSSSKFVPKEKSDILIGKIKKQCSQYEAEQIYRKEVHVAAGNMKTDNQRIYYNVDAISRAIREKKQIQFLYFDYNFKHEKAYRGGIRVCSPYGLVVNEERYYLVAFYEKHKEHLTNFRVDRMEKIEILEEDAVPNPDGEFDADRYLSSSFSMFSGEEEIVTLRLPAENKSANFIFDRFGKDANIFPEVGGKTYIAKVPVKLDKIPRTFLAWVFQFGKDMEIVEPQWLQDAFQVELKNELSRLRKSMKNPTEYARKENTNMIQKLQDNLDALIQEAQIKLAYSEMPFGINYTLQTLAHLLQTEPEREQIYPLLTECVTSREFINHFGKIDIRDTDKGYCLTIPVEGVKYVHEELPTPHFLQEFIAEIRNPRCTLESIIAVFQKYSSHVHIQHVTNNDEFDYLIYFEDSIPDMFWYCLNTQDLGITYHRYLKEDFEDFGFVLE